MIVCCKRPIENRSKSTVSTVYDYRYTRGAIEHFESLIISTKFMIIHVLLSHDTAVYLDVNLDTVIAHV